MLSIERSADYNTLLEVDTVECWLTWEEWSRITLDADAGCALSILDATEWAVYCSIERSTVLARKAKTAIVRPGYVYALGLAVAIPCGFMPVVAVGLYGALVLGAYEHSRPEVDKEYYNHILDQA